MRTKRFEALVVELFCSSKNAFEWTVKQSVDHPAPHSVVEVVEVVQSTPLRSKRHVDLSSFCVPQVEEDIVDGIIDFPGAVVGTFLDQNDDFLFDPLV